MISGDRRARCDGSKLDGSELDSGKIDGGEVKDDKIKKKNLFKPKKLSKFKKTVGSLDSLTPETKLEFTKLKQAILKAPILHQFDPK